MKRARSRLGLLLVLGMLTALLPVGAVAPAGAATINDVIINELDSDTAGTDTLEFVELYDGGDGNTALDGLVVVFYNGSATDNASYDAFDLDGFTTDANGYFTLGNAGVVPAPSIIFGSNGLQNGADAVALYTGDATDFPSGTALTTANVIDAIVYDTADADDAQLLAILNPGQPQVNEAGAGDKDGHSNQRCLNGEGGALNTSSYIQATPTPAATNNCSVPQPTVFISEFHYDNYGTDAGEFVEVTGDAGAPLAGWSIVLYNGSNGTVYETIGLGGTIDDEDGTSGALAFFQAGIQNGSPDGLALVDPTGTVVEFLSYEGAFTAVGGPADGLTSSDIGVSEPGSPIGQSLQLINGTWTGPVDENPGDLNTPPAEFGACGDPATFIHAIQGEGLASPIAGQTVEIEAIVVGDFQEYDGEPSDEPLDGFMVQEENADDDGNPATSEGVFVYDPGGLAVAVGDLVRLKGTVSEFYDLTEIGSVTDLTICSSGNPFPSEAKPIVPTSVGEPLIDWEAIEGMRVSFSQPLFVTGLFPHSAFGEVQLSAIGAQDHPNQVAVQRSTAAADVRALNNASRVILDDGEDENESFPNSSWNPSVTPYLDPMEGTLRSGDRVDDLAGVVHYSFGEYEVHPVNLADETYPAGAIEFTRVVDRPFVPEVGGSLQVASFNVLNYFTTFGSRGADNLVEFERQAAKIVDALIDIDADIVGLMEIENNGDDGLDSAIYDLVSRLNADIDATRTYGYVDTGNVGGDAIAVAFIYDVDTVSTVGDFAILDSSVSPAFLDTRNRPAVVQTFREASTAEMITLAVNHLKSKGSACDGQYNPGDLAYGVDEYFDDPDLADFAGNCNLTRTAAAQVLGQWLGSDPTGAGAEHTMIMGDLNAYANEDPITALEGLGYTDLNQLYSDGNSWANGGHTYVFDGELGSLDYAMANAATLQRVTGAAAWHINADEPFALDYNDYNPADNYNPDEWKASDHDPVIVGLDLAQPMVDKMALLESLDALLPAGDRNTTKRVEKAIENIDASLNPDWWIDDQTITNKKVFDNERQAVVQLELVVASGVPEATAAQEAIDIIVNADRQLARIAIITATNAGGDPVRLAKAELAMSKAATYVDAGRYNEAINAYKKAWDLATKA